MNMRIIWILLNLLLIFGCNRPQEVGTGGTEQAVLSQQSQIDTGVSSRLVPVEAMRIQKIRVKQIIPLTGVMHPLNGVNIVSEGSGKVTELNGDIGDRISRLDTLAFIDDRIPLSNFRQAQSQLLSAENNLKIAELNLQSDKLLFENGDISELAFENARLAYKTAEAGYLSAKASLSLQQKNYLDTRIMSPIDGVVSRKFITLGAMVNPGMVVFHVVDLSIMKVDVGIPQELIRLVRKDTPAHVRISALNDALFNGYVKTISPQADERTGSFSVEIHVRNRDENKILAGMTAGIDLILTDLTESLVIPDYALVNKNDSSFAYKVQGGEAQLVPLTLHKAFGSAVVVDRGLADGDTIVIVGMKNLGVRTRIFLEKVHVPNGFLE